MASHFPKVFIRFSFGWVNLEKRMKHLETIYPFISYQGLKHKLFYLENGILNFTHYFLLTLSK